MFVFILYFRQHFWVSIKLNLFFLLFYTFLYNFFVELFLTNVAFLSLATPCFFLTNLCQMARLTFSCILALLGLCKENTLSPRVNYCFIFLNNLNMFWVDIFLLEFFFCYIFFRFYFYIAALFLRSAVCCHIVMTASVSYLQSNVTVTRLVYVVYVSSEKQRK